MEEKDFYSDSDYWAQMALVQIHGTFSFYLMLSSFIIHTEELYAHLYAEILGVLIVNIYNKNTKELFF